MHGLDRPQPAGAMPSQNENGRTRSVPTTCETRRVARARLRAAGAPRLLAIGATDDVRRRYRRIRHRATPTSRARRHHRAAQSPGATTCGNEIERVAAPRFDLDANVRRFRSHPRNDIRNDQECPILGCDNVKMLSALQRVELVAPNEAVDPRNEIAEFAAQLLGACGKRQSESVVANYARYGAVIPSDGGATK